MIAQPPPLRPVWSWRLNPEQRNPEQRAGDSGFPTRFDAEAWLGERWRALAAGGVTSAVLVCDDADTGPPIELRDFRW